MRTGCGAALPALGAQVTGTVTSTGTASGVAARSAGAATIAAGGTGCLPGRLGVTFRGRALLLSPQRLIEATQRGIESRVDFGTPLITGSCAGFAFRRRTAVATLTRRTASFSAAR